MDAAYVRPDHDWIQTYTGRRFWIVDPRPDTFNIRDIAHSLSNQCRFTGHVRKFYSIAEHSVRMVRMLMRAGRHPDVLYACLMHDTSEAYLTDIASPFKKLEVFQRYREVEDFLMQKLSEVFDFHWPLPAQVKKADKAILAVEARDLLKHNTEDWFIPPVRSFHPRIHPWRPEKAEKEFLRLYERLRPARLAEPTFFGPFGLWLKAA